MAILRNNNSVVRINEIGAELKSFIYNNEEMMWSSDPDVWTSCSPVLFPIVGCLKNGKYTYKDKEYSLTSHGFCRQRLFEIEKQTENSIVFFIKSNDETKAMYPFDFIFKVIYELNDNILKVSYEVQNSGTEEMLFSLGAHPGFRLPMNNTSIKDYYIEFDEKETLQRYKLIGDSLQLQEENYLDNDDIINLDYNLFDEDALIFRNIKSKNISIKNYKTSKEIKVDLGNAPDLGIWSKPKANAPFVCIEPWYGHADLENSTGNLEEKAGIQKLEPSKTFKSSYSVEIVSL